MTENNVAKKPIVFLTNFWDANKIISNKFAIIKFKGNDGGLVKLISDDSERPLNFEAYSIALGSPSFDKLPHLAAAFKGRIDHFCPTYDLLMDYKKNSDWAAYEVEYKQILRDRKDRIKEWFSSLEVGKAYILCCWENTSKGSHCHREIMYNAFKHSEAAKKHIFPVYRHGQAVDIEKRISDRINTGNTTDGNDGNEEDPYDRLRVVNMTSDGATWVTGLYGVFNDTYGLNDDGELTQRDRQVDDDEDRTDWHDEDYDGGL